MSDQRSNEWFEQRRGKFTSSKFNDLMGVKGLGKTGETYCFKKAVEVVFGLNDEDDLTTFDMQRGIDLEPLAFADFAIKMEAEFKTAETCGFIELNEYTGSSPDGLVIANPLEIKCPKRDKFFRLIVDGIDGIDQVYYDQMQHQMWCTGGDQAYFHNYYISKGEPYSHTIIVPRDDKRIELMEQRLIEAVEIRNEFINKLKQYGN
jgi:putative phage-type endonuclease